MQSSVPMRKLIFSVGGLRERFSERFPGSLYRFQFRELLMNHRDQLQKQRIPESSPDIKQHFPFKPPYGIEGRGWPDGWFHDGLFQKPFGFNLDPGISFFR